MFDTLKFARSLRDRGHFTPEQAEGLADAVAEALETEVASSADLKATEKALRGEADGFRMEIRAEFAKVRQEIADLRTELKSELADLRTELRTDGANLRTEMRSLETKIEATQASTIKWVVGIVGFQGVAFIAAVWIMARSLAH